jgi:hypothetical protein
MNINPEMLCHFEDENSGLTSSHHYIFTLCTEHKEYTEEFYVQPEVQCIRFKHICLIFIHNQLHVVANIQPSSGWLEKQEEDI